MQCKNLSNLSLILGFKSLHCIAPHLQLIYLYRTMILLVFLSWGTMVCMYIYAFESMVCNRNGLWWLSYHLCIVMIIITLNGSCVLYDENIIFEICYIMIIWKLFASLHQHKQGKLCPLVKFFVHSLLRINLLYTLIYGELCLELSFDSIYISKIHCL
jgi:hypothetical protein